jgi:ribonuclease HI
MSVQTEIKNANDTNDDVEMKTFKIDPMKHAAFTDGGAHPNNKSDKSIAGYASTFVSGPLNDTRIYGNLCNKEHNASNIRAEGMAIVRTLELVNKSKEPWDEFDIITDCKFWVDMLERYMPKWSSTKFKSQSNPDLTMRLWRVWNSIGKKGTVRILHMNSHGKSGWNKYPEGSYEKYCYEQNDYVDKLCNYARLDMDKGEEIIDMVEYD